MVDNFLISLGSFFVSLVALAFTSLVYWQNKKFQGQRIFRELVVEQADMCDFVLSRLKTNSLKRERILNFYSHLSLLYLEKVIDKKLTEKTFKSVLIKVYEKYKSSLKPEHKDFLEKLYKKWKNQHIQDNKLQI